jgi:hypothetical protein
MERNLQTGRWIELKAEKIEEDQRISRQLGGKISPGRPESGVEAAARELGIPEPTARRAVRISTTLRKSSGIRRSFNRAKLAQMKASERTVAATVQSGTRAAARELDIPETVANRAVRIASMAPADFHRKSNVRHCA